MIFLTMVSCEFRMIRRITITPSGVSRGVVPICANGQVPRDYVDARSHRLLGAAVFTRSGNARDSVNN